MAHQREGVDFLLARRAGIIAFEQGLGKTLVCDRGVPPPAQGGRSSRDAGPVPQFPQADVGR